jgi:hypothetical protein
MAKQPKETEIERTYNEIRRNEIALYAAIDDTMLPISEAQREKLRELVFKATFQNALLLGRADAHNTGQTARKGNRAKAAVWETKAEDLTSDLWIEDPDLHGNASVTAHKIYDALWAALPKETRRRALGTVARYLMSGDVRKRVEQKMEAKKGNCE